MGKRNRDKGANEDAQSMDETQNEQVENESTDEESMSQEVSAEAELQNKYDELNDKYLRLYSEFDNFRRRTAKERIDLITNAGEGVIKDLLTVLDDFDRAIAYNENSEDARIIKEGFHLIYNKFTNILENKGLTAMESKGAPFNTELHDAVANFPVEDKNLKEKVIVNHQNHHPNESHKNLLYCFHY